MIGNVPPSASANIAVRDIRSEAQVMMNPQRQIAIVGDVLSKPLFRFDRAGLGFAFELRHHDIDQHIAVLLSADAPDVLISHYAPRPPVSPDGWPAYIASFQTYLDAARGYARRQRGILVLNTLLGPIDRLIGLDHLEALAQTARLNQLIGDLAREERLVVVADLAGALCRVGLDRALNWQNELVMRMPYTAAAIPAIVGEYAKVIRERFCPRKKVLVVDADNTLWRGTVGEDGIDGIEIGSEYPGSVFATFQRTLLAARRSGLMLALVSKNNEADVREVFEKRAMPLAWNHFSGVRVNWLRKSENIASLASELQLGLDSFVFIDDNPFEIAEVGTTLPDVSCVRFEWEKPNEALPLLFRQAGLSSWAITDEDLRRSAQYAEEAGRRAERTAVGSIDEYIRSLDIRLEVGCNRRAALARIVQLTNKTNQFNLTTRRYSDVEIRQAMDEGHVYDFRVIDRFGDMGIVGVVIVRRGEIETFLMSCRALGREIEGNMLAYVCGRHAGEALSARYLATARNPMVADFYDRHGFRLIEATDHGRLYACVLPEADRIPVPIVEVNE